MKKAIARSVPSTRKPAAKKGAPEKAAPEKAAPKKAAAPASKNILAAGIKALSNVHEEAMARQSRVFESILGLAKPDKQPDASAANPLTAALDPFGFRKFEDVFDQRVARSLEHLGVPSSQSFAELKAEVERLRDRIARLEARDRKR